MASYTTFKVNISEGQKQKFQHAVKGGCPVSIRLGLEDLQGNDIEITNSQAKRKKMAKAYEKGTGITIRMSAKQLKHNTKIEGGFLGMLAGLAARPLPMIAKTGLPALCVGALSGLASSGVQKGQVFTLKKEDVFVR